MMQLQQIERGKRYVDRNGVTCLVIGCHPEDGALLIVETENEEEDETDLSYREASDFTMQAQQ